MRLKLTLEYDGTAYHGWQVQPNGVTVQGALEQAAARVLGHSVRIAAAGRTDAGVHAAGQVACFDTGRDVAPDVVQRALNALTPEDVAVQRVEVVADDFDPRRAASRRAYAYRIWNERIGSVFCRRYAWHVARRLEVAAMAEAARGLEGEHDFSSFRAAGCDAAHPVRRVFLSELTAEGALLTYRVEATAFLRHMVRNIVGTLVEVGLGERSPAQFVELLGARDRTLAGPTAPPHGLCLEKIWYERGRTED